MALTGKQKAVIPNPNSISKASEMPFMMVSAKRENWSPISIKLREM